MTLTRLSASLVFLASIAVAGCGGGGGSTPPVDTPPVDTFVPPVDTPPSGLTALGKACTTNEACPANAPLCVLFSPNKGICTKNCVANSAFTTNAQGTPGGFNPAPGTGDAQCPPIYNGNVGTARCAVAYNLMPADNPLQPNKAYTVQWGCGIQCGPNNTCPAGLTCGAQSGLCDP